MKEYCVTLEPLSRGLDILQGEDRCYYGTLLPTLETIVKKTKAEVPNLSPMTTGLAHAVESSIKRRFHHIFDSKDAIIAALASPKFKLKWVDSQDKKDAYKQTMVDKLRLLESDTLTEWSEWNTRQRKKYFFMNLTLTMIRSQQMMWKVKLLIF